MGFPWVGLMGIVMKSNPHSSPEKFGPLAESGKILRTFERSLAGNANSF